MSGHKRLLVNLNAMDQRRMNELYARLQRVERDTNAIQSRIQSFNNEQLASNLHNLEKRQENFMLSLGDMDLALREVEENITSSLLNYTSQFHQSILEAGDSLWQNTNQLLHQQSMILQNLLDEHVISTQSQLVYFNQFLEQCNEDQRRKQTIAEEILTNAQLLLRAIEENYDTERYLPGRLSQEALHLEVAQKNLINGLYEASLAIAQQTHIRLSAFRLELENIILQHNLALQSIMSKELLLEDEIESLKFVPAIDLEGKELEVFIDVEYWSWGEWREISRKCKQIKSRIDRIGNSLSFQEINSMAEELDEIESRIPMIIAQARQNVLASQIRYNLAEWIVQALSEQGFVVQHSNYDLFDQRMAYEANLIGYDGSEVWIKIEPEPHDPFGQAINVISNDADLRTEHELRQRALAIRTALQVYGLNVNIETVPDKTDAEVLAFSAPQPSFEVENVSKQRNTQQTYQSPSGLGS